ncbi:hypothetical protein SeLEV6574_g03480 [Synchytrium endobioticum]|uniref:RAD50-interacting protein 1 n=1 Tax=Synchytrium endobioticum TaxID=286115 RepID=A0A507D3G8_9FUNG|nr:hypothetical protein SeLEV6574_g03480 [Synchytrium endobioticum]
MYVAKLQALLPDEESLDSINVLVDQFSQSLVHKRATLQERAASTPEHVRALQTDAMNLKSSLARVQNQIEASRRDINSLQSGPANDAIHFVQQSRRDIDQLRSISDYLATVSKYIYLMSQVENDLTTLDTYRNALSIRNTVPLSSNGLRLINNMDRLINTIKGNLRTRFSSTLDQRLVNLGWPAQINTANTQMMNLFRETFFELITLESLNGFDSNTAQSGLALPSTAVESLAKPILLRFEYHFSGDRPTNRRDKPEWMFKFIQKAISDHALFLAQHIQPLFDGTSFKGLDAKNEFIQCLLIAVIKKLKAEAPNRIREPSLLSHCIQAALEFDRVLVNTFDYEPRLVALGNARTSFVKWRGCVSIYLDDADVFNNWLRYEKERTERELRSVVTSSTAWEFELALSEEQDLKPTIAARQFMTLFDTLTETYSQLPSLSHRLSFFSSLSLDALEEFLSSVRETSEKAYRTLPSISNMHNRHVTLSSRIEALCKCVSSLDCVCAMLRERAESDFYLDLWDHISATKHDVSDKLPLATTAFDEVIQSYESCIARICEAIQDVAFQDFVESVWMYEKKRSWSDNIPITATTPSPELLPSLCIFHDHLDLIRHHLPLRIFTRHVLIPLTSRIDEHLFQRVVLQNQFSKSGAAAFSVDVWQGIIRHKAWLSYSRRAEKLFARLLDAAHLLNLPTSAPAGTLSVRSIMQPVGVDDKSEIEVGLTKLSGREMTEVLSRRLDFA